VAAVADSDPARLAAARRAAPAASAHEDYRRLLDDRGLDVVAVCVPPALHAPVALAAMAAGKHVLVEKPLAHRLEGADRIVGAASESGRVVGVGHQMRCHRLIVEARRILAEGGLGTVTAACSRWTTDLRHPVGAWQRAPGQGGSVLCDIGLHHLDLFSHLLGRRIVSVSAGSEEDGQGGGRAAVTATLEGGAVATSLFARGTVARNEIDLFGDRGSLRVDCYRFDGLERFGASRGLAARARASLGPLAALAGAAGAVMRGGDYLDAYRRHWLAFAAAVRGEGPVPCPPAEARHALAAALAGEASARLGSAVAVGHDVDGDVARAAGR
jgi:predicted dehydrogenase